MNTKLTIGSKIKDSEGNIFTVTGYRFERITNRLNGVDLKGAAGEKTISIYDLKYYEDLNPLPNDSINAYGTEFFESL